MLLLHVGVRKPSSKKTRVEEQDKFEGQEEIRNTIGTGIYIKAFTVMATAESGIAAAHLSLVLR